MHVKLFYKGSPVALPAWFRKNRSCKLTNITQLENFPSHIKNEIEQFPSTVFGELREIRYTRKPIYSSNVLRYALMLRYTSLPAYKLMQEEFNLPSVSMLRKISSGSIDSVKSANILRENGSISKDIILIFDEMFLQKSEGYVGGEMIGADKEGHLYKGIMSFMIVGLKSSVPYVIKAIPEKKIEGGWLKNEIKSCIEVLQESGFIVRG